MAACAVAHRAGIAVIFKHVPAGDYAIIAYQDKNANANGRLDRNAIGFPAGPPGFGGTSVWFLR
ncbi:DUF2141 domain-containing protein [Cupriavidus sp. 2TAF22]|uniref:DUF2141 domain-containing protein n=1 Tax=unclassified Cupriavidus TaxID=2640874 RepID=UPI003F9185EE